MVGEDDALSLGNHEGYIATCAGFDNEADARLATLRKQKGPVAGPFKTTSIAVGIT
jgi:hypothetical protein